MVRNEFDMSAGFMAWNKKQSSNLSQQECVKKLANHFKIFMQIL